MPEQLFLKILNMSISASYLVLAVIALRFLLKKAPKWVNVLLWGIVAIRLLCPFTLESALSLIPSAQTVSPEIMLDPTPTIDSGIPAVNNALNPILTETFAPDPVASANPLQIWIFLASILWLAGMGLMTLYTIFSYWRLHRRLRTATVLAGNLYQSEHVSSPFILGLLRPKIYLPYHLENPDISYVIAHEQAHILRRDHWWKPLGFSLLTVYWFNPLLWAAYILLCRDIELACDERVIRDLGKQQRADYSQALLNSSIHRRHIVACPLAFGEVGVRERVIRVLRYKKPAFWMILIALILCLVVSICFLTNPKTELPFIGDLATVISAETLDQRVDPSLSRSLPADEREELAFRLRDIAKISPYKTDTGNSIIPLYSLNANLEELGIVSLQGISWDSDQVLLQYRDELYLVEDPDFIDYLDRICAGNDIAAESASASGASWAPVLTVEEASPTGATIVFRQTAEDIDGILVTGNEYFLQQYVNSHWEAVPTVTQEITWSSETFAIYAIPREKLDWQWLYGTLPEGRYRIGKPVTIHRDTVNQVSTTAYGEFTILPATPYAATSTLTDDDVSGMDITLSPLALEEEEMTFLREEVGKLVSILNDLDEDAFYKAPAISPNTAITIHGHDDADSLYLESDGELVTISHDLSSPEAWEQSTWTVKNDALNRYIAGLWELPQRLSALACPEYRVSEILYEAPNYAGTYVPGENTPSYAITENGHLLAKSEFDTDDHWADMGKFDITDFTAQNFDPHFRGSFDAASIRENTQYGWILFTHNQSVSNDLHYWLLQQKNGDLLLAYVYPNLGYTDVIWLMKLEYAQSAASSREVRKTYDTLEEAFDTGFPVMKDGVLQYNPEDWESFLTVATAGIPASVRYIEMMEDFSLRTRDLTFDGEKYTLRRYEEDTDITEVYSYLHLLEEEYPLHIFLLTDSPTLSYDSLPEGILFSSDHTYLHIPSDLQSAALQLKDAPLITLYDSRKLSLLHAQLSTGQIISGSPDVFYLGPALSLQTADGKEIRILLDLYGEVLLYNSFYYRCDISGILEIFGCSQWPEEIIRAYPEVPFS